MRCARVDRELEPADQPNVNRLVVGSETLRIERFEPVGDLQVRTPAGRRTLRHAATVAGRGSAGPATYVYGEHRGHLVGVRSAG